MEFIQRQSYGLSYLQENIETIAYSAICFLVPFLIGHPQFFVGTIVNAALILGALNLRSYRLLPIILLPSIAVVSRGLVFGPMMLPLLYLIPVIWLGNTVLVLGVKRFGLKSKTNLALSGLAKVLIIFTFASALVYLGLVPTAIMGAMGLMQLYTFATGAVSAMVIQYIKHKYLA